MKFRRERRSTLPIEPVWSFYPRYWLETAAKQVSWISLYLRLRMIYLRIKKNPKRRDYTDLALTPVADDETETHELFQTEAAQAYVSQERRLQDMRAGPVGLVPDQPAEPKVLISPAG